MAAAQTLSKGIADRGAEAIGIDNIELVFKSVSDYGVIRLKRRFFTITPHFRIVKVVCKSRAGGIILRAGEGMVIL